MNYYHITTKDALPAILEGGLEPRIGERSKMVNEETPTVYLCRWKDLPFWKILLGKSTVLRVQSDGLVLDEYMEYDHYDEVLYKGNIPVNRLKHVYTPAPTNRHMRILCIGYLYSISYITEIAARLYNTDATESERHAEIYNDLREYLETMLNAFLAVMHNLDFSVLSKREIISELKQMGENGMYTFVDAYLDEGTRLYEQLIRYPDDELSDKRRKVYEYVVENFKGCLTVDTGGWTG